MSLRSIPTGLPCGTLSRLAQSAIGDRQSRGFTLVELLVASALTMILGLALLGVFASVAGSYQVTEARADTFREGRAALHLISGELRHLLDVAALAEASTGGASAPPSKVEIGVARDAANASLGFLVRLPYASQPDPSMEQTTSEVCLVGYFLDDSSGRGTLYRTLVPSRTVFDRLAGGGVSFFAEEDFDPDNDFTEPVAANVVEDGFRVELLDADLQAVSTVDAATHLRLTLRIIGNRAAENYFDPQTPGEVRDRLAAREVREFTLRWKL